MQNDDFFTAYIGNYITIKICLDCRFYTCTTSVVPPRKSVKKYAEKFFLGCFLRVDVPFTGSRGRLPLQYHALCVCRGQCPPSRLLCICGLRTIMPTKIIIPPHSGGYFIFGHSPMRYWLRTSALFIGLPATHRLPATHKWVVILCRLPLSGRVALRATRSTLACARSRKLLAPLVRGAVGGSRLRGSLSFSLPPSFCFAKIHLPRQREA